MTIGDEHIPAQTKFKRANCVLKVVPRSVGVLAYVCGGEPELLSDKMRG